jgi:Flp pilus assembly protein TadG
MKNKKGQALVEFAIILPVLFLLLFGIFEFGRAMYIKNTLNNAARSAVRVAVVTPSLVNEDLTFSNTIPADTETIKLKIFENLLYIDKTNTIATVRVTGNSPAQPGDTVTVTVTGPFESIVSRITDSLQISISDTLSGEASMRYE